MSTLQIQPTASQAEAGVAHIEFLFVFLLMVFILLGGFEFARYLRVSESISQVSREVAKQSFRECLLKSDSETAACLQGIINAATTPGAIDYNGLRLVVSVWRATPPSPGNPFPPPMLVSSVGSISNLTTRLPTVASLGSEVEQMITLKSQIQIGPTVMYRSGAIIVEASIPYSRINSAIFPFVPLEVNEVTIF